LLRNIVAELARRQIPVTIICPDFGRGQVFSRVAGGQQNEFVINLKIGF
jgi:hypothetical protein